MGTQPIVVGFDGSPDATAAAVWAVDEAARRRASVRLIYACELWPAAERAGSGARARARSVVSAGAKAARVARPAVAITGTVLAGPPHVILTLVSHHASLVVVGSRGADRATEPVLGPVGLALAGHAHCPVVVVREPERPSVGRAHVLVGVDGSADSLRALAFGFEYAERCGLPLHALDVWVPPPHRWPDAAPDDEHRHLASTVAPWREKFPTVPVTWEVARGPAAEMLVEASRYAHLAVIGPRGQGEYSQQPLGSVSQHVLRHAHCPVAVVREPGTPS